MAYEGTTKTFSRVMRFESDENTENGDTIRQSDFDKAFDDIASGINSVAREAAKYESKEALLSSGVDYTIYSAGDVIQAGDQLYTVMLATEVTYQEVTVSGVEGDGGLRLREAGFVFSSVTRAQQGDTLGSTYIWVAGQPYEYDALGSDLTTGDGRTWQLLILPVNVGGTGGQPFQYFSRSRDAASAQALVALGDGTIGGLGGRTYVVNVLATDHNSATHDLSVDGLEPFGDFVTAEHFGCDPSGTTDCTTEFQTFVNWVTKNRANGIALGAYVVSSTIEVGQSYVDGSTNTASTTGFFLSIGSGSGNWTAEQNTTGLIYKGAAGSGGAPHEVTPIIAFHNCNFYNLGNIVVSQPKGEAKSGICGVRWTGSDNKQTGNALVQHVAAFHCERGVVIGLNDHDGTSHDCFEKVVVQKLEVAQTRHPFYMSAANCDGWTFQHLQCVAYNSGGNGPQFYLDDLANFECEKVLEIDRSGNGSLLNIELAQMDMLTDGNGVVVSLGSGTHFIDKCTIEISNCQALETTSAANGRNPKIIHNLFTNSSCFIGTTTATQAQYQAARIIGDVRLVDCSFAGDVQHLRNISAINTAFWYDGSGTYRDFVPAGGNDKSRTTILNTKWFQSNAVSEDRVSNTIPFLNADQPTITGGTASQLALSNGDLSGMTVTDGLGFSEMFLSTTLNSGGTASETVLNDQSLNESRLHEIEIVGFSGDAMIGLYRVYLYNDADGGTITHSGLVTVYQNGSFAAPTLTVTDNGNDTYDLTLANTEANNKKFHGVLKANRSARDAA